MRNITRVFDLLDLYREEYQGKPDAFLTRPGNHWKSFSAADYVSLSDTLSRGLLSMGVNSSTRIATVMVNCPEWNFFDMAIQQAGAVQVPIYPSVSEDTYRYILEEAQVRYLILYDAAICRRIRHIAEELPCVEGIFSIHRIKGVRHWSEILEAGRKNTDPGPLESARALVDPDTVMSIIYTSGTTGRPKGVMLTHRNFVSNFTECARIPGFSSKEKALSFLPLCHVYERMLNYVYQSLGMTICYVQSLDQVQGTLREIKPETFAAVPRVLEKIYDRIVAQGNALKGIRRVIFFWALRQAHKYELGQEQGFWYRIKWLAARILVYSRLKKALGGHVKIIVCGGASLHPRLARFFWASGLKVLEGYGLTETAPVIAVQNLSPGGMKFGTVGPVLPGVEVRIASDGEILCRGPNVMKGYFNRPDRTSEVFDTEGWFHTGDIGQMIDGKYLKITDRKKEIFKTSTGRTIAPQPIEQRFSESPFIDQIMVLGDDRKYVAALIVPNFEYLRAWCSSKKIPYSTNQEAVSDARIVKRIQQEVRFYNRDLGRTEKIKKFRLIPAEWSVSTGELSPTLKLRRKFIQEKYYHVIEETYRSPEYEYLWQEDQ